MQLNTLKITKEILAKYNIKANKRFGQNFLIDDNILQNIVQVSDINQNDLIIEIGPGLGNLSEYILNNCKYDILIEIDNNMINILNDRLKQYTNYTLLNADVLNTNIDYLISEIEEKYNIKFNNIKVVANLPYYITTPIIFKLLQEENRVNEITVMVQKEVAQRMVAKPRNKDYGILTLMVEYLSSAKIQFIVPNTSFIPSPDVTSAVISLKKEKKYITSNEKMLFDLIHSSFAQRRKKMINSLESCNFNQMDKKALEKLLDACNINLNTRAEELQLEKYIEMVEILEK